VRRTRTSRAGAADRACPPAASAEPGSRAFETDPFDGVVFWIAGSDFRPLDLGRQPLSGSA